MQPAKLDPRGEQPERTEDNAALYASGAVIVAPKAGIHYARARLGPGNEAMAGGASPAPRGLTGGAMGKFIAGLSPSFAEAAMGVPAPGGLALYTPAEGAVTFRAPPGRLPDATPYRTEGAAEQPA
ncbi:MAG TPA: hypothetical protein VID73_13590 [Ktedonobacterales bacterium]|jgi:hypothetical protein